MFFVNVSRRQDTAALRPQRQRRHYGSRSNLDRLSTEYHLNRETCSTGNEHCRDLKLPPAASGWRANTQSFLPQRSVDILCRMLGKARALSGLGGSGTPLQVWRGVNSWSPFVTGLRHGVALQSGVLH